MRCGVKALARDLYFIVFLSLVLGIYVLANGYIFIRGWQAFSWIGWNRYWAAGVFFALALTYPFSRLSEGWVPASVTEASNLLGAFYLAAMVYLFLATLAIDLIRLAGHLLPLPTGSVRGLPRGAQRLLSLGVVAVVMGAVLAGHLNALEVRIRTLELSIPKRAGGLRSLNIVVASDLHLGKIIGNSRLGSIVGKINELKPDLVLLPGDVVDESADHLREEETVRRLLEIKSAYGVFAVTGNHEYYANLPATVAELEKGNVTVLQDAWVKIADSFYLIGRKDRTAERYGGGRRPLGEILDGVDRRCPMILMDHQPFHLEEAKDNGIDLQLSGHTHHGQLFPFNLVTRLVYELSWGYLKKGKTHYYVSSGVGTWGPPVRIGSVPEIVRIKLNFEPEGLGSGSGPDDTELHVDRP